MGLTALLVIIPVIATVLFSAIARAAMLRELPRRRAVAAVRPTVVGPAAPTIELEDHRQRQVTRAA